MGHCVDIRRCTAGKTVPGTQGGSLRDGRMAQREPARPTTFPATWRQRLALAGNGFGPISREIWANVFASNGSKSFDTVGVAQIGSPLQFDSEHAI
jgi:hypothetical protein